MKKTLLTLIRYIFLITGLFLYCQGCTENDNNPVISKNFERGEVRESINLGLITADEIQQIFADSNVLLPFTLSNTVEIVSLNYYTIDRNGDEKIVSGAIFIPQGINNLPMISLQHGTQSKRDLVASVSPYNSVEGTMGLLTASLGYFTIVPDYIGFGVSNEIHTYLHAESLIPCVIDLRIGSIKLSLSRFAIQSLNAPTPGSTMECASKIFCGSLVTKAVHPTFSNALWTLRKLPIP